MSKIEDIVNALEKKITTAVSKLSDLKQENETLKQELLNCKLQIESREQETLSWKDKYQSLKIANTMLGSDENKRETKLKINALIREIDHCIGQLSE